MSINFCLSNTGMFVYKHTGKFLPKTQTQTKLHQVNDLLPIDVRHPLLWNKGAIFY